MFIKLLEFLTFFSIYPVIEALYLKTKFNQFIKFLVIAGYSIAGFIFHNNDNMEKLDFLLFLCFPIAAILSLLFIKLRYDKKTYEKIF